MHCRASTSPSHTKKILLRQQRLAQFQSTVAVWRARRSGSGAAISSHEPACPLGRDPRFRRGDHGNGMRALVDHRQRRSGLAWRQAHHRRRCRCPAQRRRCPAHPVFARRRALSGPPNPLFRSKVLAKWPAPPVPVDLMAGFEHRVGDIWHPVWPTTRQAIAVGPATVYVPERDELRRIIAGFGRPKDLERAGLLAALTSPP
jgi:hypothetical protein